MKTLINTCKILLILSLFFINIPSYAADNESATESANVTLVKDLFKNVIGNLDSKKMTEYFADDAVQYVNNQAISLKQDMKIHSDIYKETKKIEYHFDDIFSSGDKVVARLRFNHIDDKGKDHWFRELFIIQIKNHKVQTMWDLFVPLEPYKTINPKINVLK